jgi:hypothetical protein
VELTDAIRLYPADLPELGASATAEDISREAEALASVIHRRAAVTLAATAWKESTDALRARGGRPHYGDGQRADFVDRFVEGDGRRRRAGRGGGHDRGATESRKARPAVGDVLGDGGLTGYPGTLA